MGSDERRRSKSGMSGISPRRWPSTLLTEELSLETLQDSTYVRLVHPDHTVITSIDTEGFEVSPKGTRSEKAWSWLKKPVTSWNGRDGKETTVVMAKSKAHHSWAWLGRPPADEFQFDPTKRWPQGW